MKIVRYWKPVKRILMKDFEDSYFIGKWRVGWIARFWDLSSKDAPFGAMLQLPGMASNQGFFATEELAKARIEEVVFYWLNHLEDDLRVSADLPAGDQAALFPEPPPVRKVLINPPTRKVLLKRDITAKA